MLWQGGPRDCRTPLQPGPQHAAGARAGGAPVGDHLRPVPAGRPPRRGRAGRPPRGEPRDGARGVAPPAAGGARHGGQPQHAAGEHGLPEGGPGAVPGAGGAGGARRRRDHRLARARDAAVATLREALSRLADSDGDFATKLEADLGFHLLLCQLSGNSMLVEAWRYLEGRIRVTIMNCEADGTPSMMARDRHAPIVDAIERGDVAAAMVGRRAAHGGGRGAVRPADGAPSTDRRRGSSAAVRAAIESRSLADRDGPAALHRHPGEQPRRALTATSASPHSSRQQSTVNSQLLGISDSAHAATPSESS